MSNEWYEKLDDAVQITKGTPLRQGKAKSEPMSNYDLAVNLARAIGQGITFGFADEAEGFARGVLGGEGYEKARDEARSGLERFRSEYPVPAYGAEIAASIPMAIAGGAGLTAARLAGKVPQAAAMGGLYGAGTAKEVSDIPASAALGAGIGAGLTALTPALTEQGKALLKRGVPLTLGQATGGAIKTAEEAVSSVPLVGDVVRAARTRASEGFNTEVMNEVLKPIGVTLPKGKIGTEAFELADKAINSQYAKIIPEIGVPFTATADDLVKKYAGQLRPQEAKDLKRIINEELIGRVKNGKLTGQDFKDAQSAIRGEAYGFFTSVGSNFERKLGQALQEVSLDITERLAKANPQLGERLSKVDQAYSRLVPVREAVVKAEGAEGVFTPAQLQSAIRSDAKRQKRQLALGRVPLQQLAREGRATLPAKLPDSGTATRSIVANTLLSGAGGSTVGFPLTGAALGGLASAAYTRPAQAFLRQMLPRSAAPIRSPASAGLLAQELGVRPAQAGEMPIEDVVSIGGRNYAITDEGATYTLLGD